MFAGEDLKLDGTLSFDPDGDITTQPVFKWQCRQLLSEQPCMDLVRGEGRLKIDERNKVSINKNNIKANVK